MTLLSQVPLFQDIYAQTNMAPDCQGAHGSNVDNMTQNQRQHSKHSLTASHAAVDAHTSAIYECMRFSQMTRLAGLTP